jgi:hypothetical protein
MIDVYLLVVWENLARYGGKHGQQRLENSIDFGQQTTNISTSILMKNIITNTHTYACNMRMTKLQKS